MIILWLTFDVASFLFFFLPSVLAIRMSDVSHGEQNVSRTTRNYSLCT